MKLLDDAKKFTGNVVCVGVTNNDLLNVLAKNKKASVYTIDFTKRHGFLSRKKTKKVDGKKGNIKKLRFALLKHTSSFFIILNIL